MLKTDRNFLRDYRLSFFAVFFFYNSHCRCRCTISLATLQRCTPVETTCPSQDSSRTTIRGLIFRNGTDRLATKCPVLRTVPNSRQCWNPTTRRCSSGNPSVEQCPWYVVVIKTTVKNYNRKRFKKCFRLISLANWAALTILASAHEIDVTVLILCVCMHSINEKR